MHRIFHISEIVSEILEFRLAGYRGDDGTPEHKRNTWNRDIVALALPCHTLLEPALNVLWRRLHSPDKLLALFPDDVTEAWNMDRRKLVTLPYEQDTLQAPNDVSVSISSFLSVSG